MKAFFLIIIQNSSSFDILSFQKNQSMSKLLKVKFFRLVYPSQDLDYRRTINLLILSSQTRCLLLINLQGPAAKQNMFLNKLYFKLPGKLIISWLNYGI